jgi:hypothetical protein
MSDNAGKSKKADGGHGHSDNGHDDHDNLDQPFVPEDSLHDWALVALAVLTAVGMVGLMGIWMLLPLPEVEGSPNTPTVEGAVSKP